MSKLRTERFSDPAALVRVAEGDKVPPLGWAIRFDGDVFFDGVQVGRSFHAQGGNEPNFALYW